MKKIFATFLMVLAMLGTSVVFAGPASATWDHERVKGKKQTICHFTNEHAPHQYNKIEVDVDSIVPAPTGHSKHDDKADIIPPFTYYEGTKDWWDRDWEWTEKTFPGQGDQSLLAFDNCEQPKVDEEIAVPGVSSNDVCEVEGDTITPVRDNDKYTTVVGDRVGDSVTVTFTASEGFVFPGEKKVVEVTVNFPNNDDCDLPETGGAAQYNTLMGVLALGLLTLGGTALVVTRQRS